MTRMKPLRVLSILRRFPLCSLLLSAACWLLPPAAAAAPPARIVSLAPNLTEILYDLGVEDRIAAVTDYCDHPPAAREKPRIGGFANPSLEAIAAKRPDWVFMTEDGNPPALERQLKGLGIRTHVFRARRIRQLPEAIRAIGGVLGVAPAAGRRAGLIEAGIARVAARNGAATGQGGKALFVVQPAPLIAAGRETTIDDAFAILGLDNIAARGQTGYPKFSLEEILRRDPDWLFFGKGRGMEGRVKPLLEKLASLDAVRKGRICFVGDAIFRLGPRIVPSLEEFAACIDARPSRR